MVRECTTVDDCLVDSFSITRQTDRTNKNALPLLQLVGADGNLSTFSISHALILSHDNDVYRWIFGKLRDVLQAAAGDDACSAVEWIIGDEDSGQVKALDSIKVQPPSDRFHVR
jgi:hypothetical protein